MKQLAGRTAVVIGGGGGIGRGSSFGFSDAGMNVVVADIEAATATAVADEITARGGTARATTVDATDPTSLAVLADYATSEFGAIHVVSNNVGVIADRQLTEASEADWAWFLEFNIMSIVRSVNVFVPHLRANGEEGHLILTSSMAGLLALAPATTGGVNTGLYTTTKHALVGYCSMLRAELEPDNIGVSVLCPGMVAGNLSATAARNRPARHGGPMDAVERGSAPSAMPNAEIGPSVVAGVRANRLFVFTHHDNMIEQLLQARFDGLLADVAGGVTDAAAGDAVLSDTYRP